MPRSTVAVVSHPHGQDSRFFDYGMDHVFQNPTFDSVSSLRREIIKMKQEIIQN